MRAWWMEVGGLAMDAMTGRLYILLAMATIVPPHAFAGIIHQAGSEEGKSPYLTRFSGRTLTYDVLGYVSRGHGTFESREHGIQPVSPGTVLLQPAGVWHCHDPTPGTTWDEYWVIYNVERVPPLFGDIAPRGIGAWPIGVRPALVDTWRRLCEAWPPFAGGRLEDACLHLHRVLHEIHHAIASPGEAPRLSELRRADSLIRARVSDARLDVAAIADAVDMGYHAFRAAFRAHVGMPPKRYWLRLKMERANECLANTAMTVTEVADYLGFSDPWYFSKLYKRLMGRAPSHRRRRS
jgi:AraC-like DNA-binding protein